MKGKLAEIRGKIAALRPVYTESGDGTLVILTRGKAVGLERGIRSVYRALARLYALDLVACREYYGNLLGQANSIPLPFSAQLVLCPVKMRSPRCRGDFTLGYVNFRQVDRIEEWDGEGFWSKVILKNGAGLPSLDRVRVLNRRLAMARLVESHYLECQGLFPGSLLTEYPLPSRGELCLLETKLDWVLAKLGH